jgi:hypothetical protein
MKDVVHLPKMGKVVFRMYGKRYEMPYLDWLKFFDWCIGLDKKIKEL